MKRVYALVGMIVLIVVFWIAWQTQPWMPAGRALHLSSTRFGDFEFQVWQRKNANLSEPFATGLFVRKQGDKWKVVLLDFEDMYRPAINLRKEDATVAVYYGSEKWGYFDETQERAFRRYHADGTYHSRTPEVIDSEPPGNWRLKLGN